MNPEEIIQGCLNGSLRHQRALYDRYAPVMMGICMRYAASEAEAEDILQEGFVTVFGKIESFRGTGELGGWIRKIMVNTALMNYRKNKKHLHQVEVAEVGYHLDSGEDLFSRVSIHDLLYMIQQLPQGCRHVFNLYAIEGFNHREIAEKLEISAGTSKSQYSRARILLKEMIEEEEKKVKENAA